MAAWRGCDDRTVDCSSHRRRLLWQHSLLEQAHSSGCTFDWLNVYRDCVGIALGLCWKCAGTVLGLRWDCVGTALAMCWDFVGTTLGLCWDWAGTVLRLCWDCSGTALELITLRDPAQTADWGFCEPQFLNKLFLTASFAFREQQQAWMTKIHGPSLRRCKERLSPHGRDLFDESTVFQTVNKNSHISWHPNVHYRVHNSSPIDCILKYDFSTRLAILNLMISFKVIFLSVSESYKLSVNAVKGNNRCLFWDTHKTHKYTVWAECRNAEYCT